jgi:hypothetical protein
MSHTISTARGIAVAILALFVQSRADAQLCIPSIQVTGTTTFTVSSDEMDSGSISITSLGAFECILIWNVAEENVPGGGDCAWLTASPTSGSVPGGFSNAVSLDIDATGLADGSYTCNLQVSSNATTPLLIVPIELNVIGSSPEFVRAADLDGDLDYISVDDDPDFGLTDEMTVEAWIEIRNVPETRPILSKWKTEDGSGSWTFTVGPDGIVSFGVSGDGLGTVDSRAYADEPLELATPHHVAGVYDGDSVAVYVDGTLSGTAPGPIEGSVYVSTSRILIGGYDYVVGSGPVQSSWDGTIDEVRIWSMAQDPCRIRALANRTLEPPLDGLVAYWPLDDFEDLGQGSGGADDVRDLSGNGHHGDRVGDVALVASPVTAGALLTCCAIAPNAGPEAITQSAGNELIEPGVGFGCDLGSFPTRDGRYLRRFRLDLDHGITCPFTVESVDFGIEEFFSLTVLDVLVNLYAIPLAAPFVYANMTLIDSETLSLAGLTSGYDLTFQNVAVTAEIDPTLHDLVVEISAPDGTATQGRFIPGMNAFAQSAPTYFSSDGCAIPEPVDVQSIGALSSSLILVVNGQGPVSIADAGAPDIGRFGLAARPNPAARGTGIRYEIPTTSDVRLAIYDVSGRIVRTLVRGVQSPGPRSVRWDGADERGIRAGSGVYFYRLEVDGVSVARKIVLAE